MLGSEGNAPRFPRRTVVLGSTGSIGRGALAVARGYPDRFTVVGLAAGRDGQGLAAQAREFGAPLTGIAAAAAPGGAGWVTGPAAAARVVEECRPDLIVNAISGLAGLGPTLAALRLGQPAILAMASKETMVAAAGILRQQAAAAGAVVVPVDSESTGLLQCLAGVGGDGVRTVYLTASGGPFWGRRPAELEDVPPEAAVKHPRWRMGRKISVDSATLFNKGLEAIEISKLFDIPLDRVQIVVHPQSVVHAMVELSDGSLLAQMGPTDMRVPIAQAMFWPQRPPQAPARLAMGAVSLSWIKPELGGWPCVRAALAAGRHGGTAPAAVSAADEVLVESYLAHKISFGAIGRGLWDTLAAHRRRSEAAPGGGDAAAGIAAILRADAWAREFARDWVASAPRDDQIIPPEAVGQGVAL